MKIRVPSDEFSDSLHSAQKKFLQAFDSNKYRFYMLNWHRRARKTTLSINLAAREAFKNPNHRYGYITSTYKAAKNIVWRDPKMLKRWVQKDIVKRYNESELYVEFINNSIFSLHGSDDPDSLRGLDFNGVIIDEAALAKEIVWTEIIYPIMAQDSSRWAVFIFTPKGYNWVFDLWNTAKMDKDWFTSELKASTSGIIPPNELVKAKDRMIPELYMQEFECLFNISGDNIVIGIQDVENNICNQVPTNKERRFTVCDVASMGGDETVIYDMINTRIENEEIYRHKDLMDTVGRLVAHQKKHKSTLIAVDIIGEGRGVYDRLGEIYNDDSSCDVYGYDGRVSPLDKETFYNKRAESWFKARELFKNNKCDVPNDPILIKQLTSVPYKYTSTGKLILEKKEKLEESPDRADAYIIALSVLDMVRDNKEKDKYDRKLEEMAGDYDFNPATV